MPPKLITRYALLFEKNHLFRCNKITVSQCVKINAAR